jgi:hypothetical protein
VGFAADALDLLGDLFELGLRSRRDDNVRTDFRECERHRRAESAAGSRHDCDLVVQPKSIEYHVRFLPSPREP